MPAHLRHAHVGQDDVGPERVDERERRLAAVGHLDLVAVLAEERAQDEADVLLVVDHQDASHQVRNYCISVTAPQKLERTER